MAETDVDYWEKVMSGESKKATREQNEMACATYRVQCEFLDSLHRKGAKPSTDALFECMERINRAHLSEKSNMAKKLVNLFEVGNEGNEMVGKALQNAALCAVKAALAARTIYESFKQDPTVKDALESKIIGDSSSSPSDNLKDQKEEEEEKDNKIVDMKREDQEKDLNELRELIGTLLPSDHLRRRLKSFGVSRSGHSSPRIVVASMASLVRTDVNRFMRRFVSESIQNRLDPKIDQDDEKDHQDDDDNNEWHWLLGLGSNSKSARHRLLKMISSSSKEKKGDAHENIAPSEYRRAANVTIGRLAAIGLLAEAQLVLKHSEVTCRLAAISMNDENLHIHDEDGSHHKFFYQIWSDDWFNELFFLRSDTKRDISTFSSDISQYIELSQTIGDRILSALKEKKLGVAEEEAAQMYSIARTFERRAYFLMRKVQAFKKVFMDLKRKTFGDKMNDCVIFMTPRDGYFVTTTKHNYYDFVHVSNSEKMIKSSKMKSQMIDRFVPGRINDKIDHDVMKKEDKDDSTIVSSSWGCLFEGNKPCMRWPPHLNSSRVFRVVWPTHDKNDWKKSIFDALSSDSKLLSGLALDGMSFAKVFDSFCEEEERALCGPNRLLLKWNRMASNIVRTKMPGSCLFFRGSNKTSVEIFEMEQLREVIPKLAPALVKLRLASIIEKLRAMELACVKLYGDLKSGDVGGDEKQEQQMVSTSGVDMKKKSRELEVVLKSRDDAMSLYKHWEARYNKARITHKACLSLVSRSSSAGIVSSTSK